MTAAKADTRKSGFETVQKARLPKNRLSVVYNLAGTECVVKVDGEIDKAALTGDVIRIYTEKDHHEVVTMLRGRAWAQEEEPVPDARSR